MFKCSCVNTLHCTSTLIHSTLAICDLSLFQPKVSLKNVWVTRARLRNTPTWVLGSAHCLVINTAQVQGLCHRGHRAKSITLKRDCLQFDPSVFTGQRRSRISLLLLPLHSLSPSLSPSLSLSLFFLLFCRSWTKKKTTRTNNIQTHIRRVSQSLQRGSHVPLQFLLGVPVWKQTRVTAWRREGGVCTWTTHGLSASIC